MEERFFALLQVSVLVGCASLLLFALRGALSRYPAKWRCALLLALCLRLLIPFRLTLPEAPITLTLPAAGTAVVWYGGPELVPAAPQTGLPAQETPQTSPLPEPESAPQQAQAVTPGQAARRGLSRGEAYLLLWAAGVLLMLTWKLGGSVLFYRRAVRWGVPAPAETAALARELAARAGLKKCPPVLVSRAVRAPVAAGLLRSVILLSEQQADLSCVLAHELCHLRRRDLWGKLLSTLALAAHWFNPAVWLLARQVSESMECACDERAVALLGEALRRDYSETILRAAAETRGAPALTTGFAGGLQARLRNLFAAKRRRGALLCALLLCALLAAGTLVACTVQKPAPEEEPQEITDLAFFDLAAEYRFDLAPRFEEGQAPTAAAEYIQYAFFTYPDRPERMSGSWNGGPTGYVSKAFLSEIAQTQFGVSELTCESIPRAWEYDGEGWSAVPSGGPDQLICIPSRITAELVDGETVYTAAFRAGDDGEGPADERDLAAARAAVEAGGEYPLSNFASLTVRFALRDGVPCFLSLSEEPETQPETQPEPEVWSDGFASEAERYLSLCQGGRFVKCGRWAVYSSAALVNLETGDTVPLPFEGNDVYFDGEYVYCPEKAARVSLDGTEEPFGTRSLRFWMTDAYIYYVAQEGYDSINGTPQGDLCRMDREGGNAVTIIPRVKNTFFIEDGTIYYTDWDSRELRSAALDGSGVRTLAQGRTYILDVRGGCVIYSDYLDSEAKHLYNTRTGENTLLGYFGHTIRADGDVYLRLRPSISVFDWTVLRLDPEAGTAETVGQPLQTVSLDFFPYIRDGWGYFYAGGGTPERPLPGCYRLRLDAPATEEGLGEPYAYYLDGWTYFAETGADGATIYHRQALD